MELEVIRLSKPGTERKILYDLIAKSKKSQIYSDSEQ
jgi:hypothetical protein